MTPPSTPRPPSAAPRLPWWGRLESRVIAALVALGILCVGASAYLVKLTVEYFDGLVSVAGDRSDQAVEIAAAHYRDLVAATKALGRARAELLARELEQELGGQSLADAPEHLQRALEREPDLVDLALVRGDAIVVEVERRAALPEESGAWIWIPVEPVTLRGPPFAAEGLGLALHFAVDPAIERRHQALGRLKRGSGRIVVGPETVVARDELERAVFRAIAAASALVLMIAFIAGFLLARATTRKVSALSRAIREVASGDLTVRVPALGSDELGLLGAAFNQMLSDLAAAQRKVAYLERVGAWQEMARRIAHEIKNPLTPIQLAVQNLRDKDSGADPRFSALLRTSVEIVEDEIEALRRMVGTFSQLAKVPEAELCELDLARVLREFARAYGHLTERDEDRLEIEDPPEVTILGDRQLLKQCLVNLVENAALSCREAGGRAMHVRIRGILGDGFVELWVEDNGPGIAEERREQVFEPYESTRAEGTGLGLAIVKKIILDHQGEIRIEEGALGGAAVVLRLPTLLSRPGTAQSSPSREARL